MAHFQGHSGDILYILVWRSTPVSKHCRMNTARRSFGVHEVLLSILLLMSRTAAVPAGQSQYLQLQDSSDNREKVIITAAASNSGWHQGGSVTRYRHIRSLAQSIRPWTNPDWINQQVEAITNMIFSVANGAKTTDGVSSNSTRVPGLPVGSHTAAPAVAAQSGVVPPAADMLPTGGTNQHVGNVSSIQTAVDLLNLPLLTGPGTSATSANVSASSNNSTSSSHNASVFAPTGQPPTVGHKQSVPNAASPELKHKSINITANITASAAAAATAAAAESPALQLISLLSDLQTSGNTTSPFPKVDYGYNVFNTSGNMPLAVPVADVPDLSISRWVLTAWSASNDSDPAALKAGDAGDRRNMLLGNFTTLQPQQVQVAVTANITLAFLFTGVEWKRPASKALQQAASEAAGGYTQAFVQVEPVEPDYGVSVDAFMNQDLQYTGDGVSDKAVTLSFLPGSSNNSNRVRHRLARKVLQLPPAAVISEPLMTRVWVQYQRVDASNVTALIRALSSAWLVEMAADSNRAKQRQQSPVWQVQHINDLQHTNNLTATLFGLYTRRLLVARGAEVSNNSYAVYLNGPPMLTTNIRLAVGITDAQTSPQPSQSTDQLVALWAANATNIVGPTARSAAPFNDSARLSWLLTPEIWTQPQLQPASPQPVNSTGTLPGTGLAAGAIAGIAVGAAAAAALLAGLLVFVVDRTRKQQAQDKTGTGRRRRKHAKPRYLLPDPPQPPAQTSTAAAAAAHDEFDRDELRAELRKLGDSVTSAARFELEEQQSEAGSDAPIAAAAAVPRNQAELAGSSSSAAAAAANCSVGAADGNLELSTSDTAAVMNSEQSLASHHSRGCLVPSEQAGSDSWPGTARMAAAAAAVSAVPPEVSPTTASLALTGAAVPLAQTSFLQSDAGPLSGAASSSGPTSGPWAVPRYRCSGPPGMLTPFANYAFDESMRQGVMPAAAASAIHAAYLRGSDEGCGRKSATSCFDAVMAISHMLPEYAPCEHSPSDPRTPHQQYMIPYLSGCSSSGSTSAQETAQATAVGVCIDGCHQPAGSNPIAAPAIQPPSSAASRLPNMSIMSPQRHSPPPRPPDTPAASTPAARVESISYVSPATVVSAWSPVVSSGSLSGSVGSSTAGTALKPASRKSPFACSYNLSELADAAPSIDSSGGVMQF